MKLFNSDSPALRPAPIILAILIITAVVVLLIFGRGRRDTVQPVPPPPEKKVIVRPAPVGLIAIIIDDFGYNFDDVTQSFLRLDADLTYAIIPGHAYSHQIAEKAFAANYEVIIHMPMESQSNQAGEDDYILKTDMTSGEIERRVRRVLDEFPQARGMNNHQGSKATESERLMTIVGSQLKETDKYFIDSRTTGKTVAEKKISAIGVPVAHRHIFLDNDSDPELIRKQVEKLARYAQKHGAAIAIGHGRPNTLAVLRSEIPRLQAAGFQFVFASRIVK